MYPEYNTCDENYTKIEIIEGQSIITYPNPVTTKLSIKIDNFTNYSMLALTNLLGIIIYSKQIKSEPEITIDMSTFEKMNLLFNRN